jgi:hypothetical protein
MDNIMERVKELSDKAAKFENLRERLNPCAAKLVQAERLIHEVIAELDPVASVKRKESSGIGYGEIAAEIYEKMQAGMEVTVELIANTYDNLDEQKAHYLMSYICNHYKGVDSRKENRKKIIYCRKESR